MKWINSINISNRKILNENDIEMPSYVAALGKECKIANLLEMIKKNETLENKTLPPHHNYPTPNPSPLKPISDSPTKSTQTPQSPPQSPPQSTPPPNFNIDNNLAPNRPAPPPFYRNPMFSMSVLLSTEDDQFINENYKAAGIINFSISPKGELVILFGKEYRFQERKVLWNILGGRREESLNEKPYLTAVREFSEESSGYFGSKFEDKLRKHMCTENAIRWWNGPSKYVLYINLVDYVEIKNFNKNSEIDVINWIPASEIINLETSGVEFPNFTKVMMNSCCVPKFFKEISEALSKKEPFDSLLKRMTELAQKKIK